MSSPDQIPHASPAPESSLLPWPENRKSKYAVPPNEWERFPHPKELEYLPDGPQTPYELRQIVKRSFYKHESQSSTSRDIKPEVQTPEAEPDLAPKLLQVGPEKQHRKSFESADSWTTCSGGSERPPAATGDAASLIPSPPNIPCPKPRELKPKSSFLALRIERLGAKIEKLELISSKRSSRTLEDHKVVATAECISCFDDLPKSELTPLSCTHSYCKPCFTSLITTAMHTESLFPPKCCLTEIPLKTVLYSLDEEQRNNYKLKAAEWAQPAENRWYCPEPKCAKWIAPSRIYRSRTSSQKCPHCRTQICGMCRGLAHAEDTECPQDFGLNAMLDIAEREGWRRCYQCKSLVEKTSGCRHMTCTCKAQFCYTCGSKWKTCGCTEVDQARREQELRERRTDFDAEAHREEEEIARAIAEVEAAERREAQERRATEQRREEERRREEEELRRLEELRIAEEEQRRRNKEEAERKRIETIKSSIEERTSCLAKILIELMQVQQIALISRHESTEQKIKTNSEERQALSRKDYESKKQKLLANVEKRSKVLKQKHDTETYATTSQHEEEEDAMFMQIQMHLRGKPNREAREKAMLESLSQSHKDELAHLTGRQEGAAAALREAAAMEAKGLEHGHRAQAEKTKSITDFKFADLDREITAERHWFEAVTRRRYALLEELRQDQLSKMGESNLLEEWEALPFPVAGPTISVSRDGQDLVKNSSRVQVPSQLPTPPPSPAAQSLALSVNADQISQAAPASKPPKPTLFISTVMTGSHTTDEKSSQSVWGAQSHVSEHSGHSSTTSRLSLSLASTQHRPAKADKPSRWSFLGVGSKKHQMDEETLKAMLRETVGDAF